MKQRIPLEEAQEIVKKNLPDLSPENVILKEASGRILAESIFAPMNQPPFARSPLDGYALRAEDTRGASKDNPLKLKIVSRIFAGDRAKEPVNSGETARIMTGAPIPEGADCVIRQENTDRENDEVTICQELRPGQNYAPAGEDIEKGELLCSRGTLLRSPQLGVLASMGLERVEVRPLPKVAVITTGNELQALGEKLEPGQIYNSNNYLISARLEECGAKVTASLVAGDNKEEIKEKITENLPGCDFLVTTGGVSVGEKDLLLSILEELGAEIFFWKLGLKPGTPIVCAKLDGTIIFGLSGNPSAAVITFDLLVRPMLVEINGFEHLNLKSSRAVFVDEFNKSSRTRRLLRAVVVSSPRGEIVKLSRGRQRPGVLKTTLECNCLIDIPAGSPPLESGQEVEIFKLPEIYNY